MNMTGFRNISVHDYQSIEAKIVKAILAIEEAILIMNDDYETSYLKKQNLIRFIKSVWPGSD